jgi:hypothetical protein
VGVDHLRSGSSHGDIFPQVHPENMQPWAANWRRERN